MPASNSRSGARGHSVAGHSTTEGGIVLDLSEMKALEFDPEHRTAWAESGVTAGASDAAAEHGLATGFGDSPSVGIGGITLGGGVGFLVCGSSGSRSTRSYGRRDRLGRGAPRGRDVAPGPLLGDPRRRWKLRCRHAFPVPARRGARGVRRDPDPAGDTGDGGSVRQASEAAPEELSTIATVMKAPPMPFLPRACTAR